MIQNIQFPEAAMRPVMASLRVHTVGPEGTPTRSPPLTPFITISRQAGAGGKTLAQSIVERLNRSIADESRRWSCWDPELVQKVAADLGTSRELVESLTETNRNWLDNFFDDVSSAFDPHRASEFKIYRRVVSTIRALAQAGRVVIVGRGGVYITRDMPGGLHLRLVAPLAHRIAAMEARRGLSRQQAQEYVITTDRARENFCRQHFSGPLFAPETFGITFNTSALSLEHMVECSIRYAVGQPATLA